MMVVYIGKVFGPPKILNPETNELEYAWHESVERWVMWNGLWDEPARYLHKTKEWKTSAHGLDMATCSDEELVTSENSAYFQSEEEAIEWCKKNEFEYKVLGEDWRSECPLPAR